MAFDAEIRAALIEQVRRFVTEKCVPIEAQVSEEDEVPQDVVDEMKNLGLFGIAVPEEYGGLALDMETEALVAMELGETSPAFRSVAGTNIGIGSQALVLFGTDAAPYALRKQLGYLHAGHSRDDPAKGVCIDCLVVKGIAVLILGLHGLKVLEIPVWTVVSGGLW